MTNSSINGQLIFDESAKIIHVWEKMVWLTSNCWQLDNYTQKNQGELLFHNVKSTQNKPWAIYIRVETLESS